MTDKPMNREQAEALAQEIVDAAFTEWIQTPGEIPYEAFLRDRVMQGLMDADKAAREDLETVRGQAYQVIGQLLHDAGKFETDEGQRALDYFAGDIVDQEFLPWPNRSIRKSIND